eukprot:TRINITY_DN2887_c0_g1_i1.p2 TRINITY_DN2887_c0_g1~~TRINITY_DN2887_c0_g1_i1.p2  ORF type:complete len:260 (-),score=85.84 TRINITY_DN2887_c0_g1_i1:36-815(-)
MSELESAVPPPPPCEPVANPLLDDNWCFRAYETSHQVVVGLFVLSVLLCVVGGRRLSQTGRTRLGVALAVVLQLTVFVWTVLRLYTGKFILSVDLPFDVCNMTAIVHLPLMMLFRNQFLFDGVFLATWGGTVQALITPHLYDEYPHITFLKFWIVHCGIVLLSIYAAAVNGQRTHGMRSILNFHVYMGGSQALSYVASLMVDGNFTYTVRPPPTGSILSHLGPWPLFLILPHFICYPIFFLADYICNAFDGVAKKPKKA